MPGSHDQFRKHTILGEKMLFKYITLLTALLLATVSGLFSVLGMMSVFSGMPWVGVVTGVAIELGKLIGVSWLYRYWKDGVWFRHLFLVGTMITLFVTSIGVYGMLSKAHTNQEGVTIHDASKIEMVEFEINELKYSIKNNEDLLKQSDKQYAEELKILTEKKRVTGRNGAQKLREKQTADREKIIQEIKSLKEKLHISMKEKHELGTSLRNATVEYGPIIHMSSLFFENPEQEISTIVKYVILLILLCLDPMAILLLMGYNHMVMREYVEDDHLTDYEENNTKTTVSEPNTTEHIEQEMVQQEKCDEKKDDAVNENVQPTMPDDGIMKPILTPKKDKPKLQPQSFLFDPGQSKP